MHGAWVEHIDQAFVEQGAVGELEEVAAEFFGVVAEKAEVAEEFHEARK
jgi:hypothetical protein